MIRPHFQGREYCNKVAAAVVLVKFYIYGCVANNKCRTCDTKLAQSQSHVSIGTARKYCNFFNGEWTILLKITKNSLSFELNKHIMFASGIQDGRLRREYLENSLRLKYFSSAKISISNRWTKQNTNSKKHGRYHKILIYNIRKVTELCSATFCWCREANVREEQT